MSDEGRSRFEFERHALMGAGVVLALMAVAYVLSYLFD